jgi:hypothetical protein
LAQDFRHVMGRAQVLHGFWGKLCLLPLNEFLTILDLFLLYQGAFKVLQVLFVENMVKVLSPLWPRSNKLRPVVLIEDPWRFTSYLSFSNNLNLKMYLKPKI